MIKELTLNYDAVNETKTFTSGNIVQGRVFLEVIKAVKISFFYIKCKGDADVRWSTGGEDGHSYHAHERYFKLKQIFIQKDSKQGGNVVRPGRHVYPFSFQLPSWDLPPSFKGSDGSIKYLLEARLYRLSGRNCTVKAKFTFVPRISSSGALLMCPQIAATEKKMKMFTSGSASIRTTIDKMGYIPGDVIKVSVNVDNSSSREVKLEYSLKQKQIFTAKRAHTSSSKTIFSVVGHPIPSGSKQTVITDLKIPPNLEPTVTTCTIIKAEYILKVRLIIPYAKDLMTEFPLVILHASQLSTLQPNVQPCGIPDESRRSSLPPQAAIGPYPPPQAAFGPNPPPQAAFGPSPPGAASCPAPGLHPSLYPSPAYSEPANPESPPPSYTDIYPQLTYKF